MEIQFFDNSKFGQLRGMNINGEAWLMATDVARRLGYTNPQKTIRDHVDDEDKTLNESFTVNGTLPILINESGLYALILSSKLPQAREFKHWGMLVQQMPSLPMSMRRTSLCTKWTPALEQRTRSSSMKAAFTAWCSRPSCRRRVSSSTG